MTNSVAVSIFKRHLGAAAVRRLAKRGIVPVGTQARRVTAPNGSWSDETAYAVADNGTHRVLTFTEINEAAR